MIVPVLTGEYEFCEYIATGPRGRILGEWPKLIPKGAYSILDVEERGINGVYQLRSVIFTTNNHSKFLRECKKRGIKLELSVSTNREKISFVTLVDIYLVDFLGNRKQLFSVKLDSDEAIVMESDETGVIVSVPINAGDGFYLAEGKIPLRTAKEMIQYGHTELLEAFNTAHGKYAEKVKSFINGDVGEREMVEIIASAEGISEEVAKQILNTIKFFKLFNAEKYECGADVLEFYGKQIFKDLCLDTVLEKEYGRAWSVAKAVFYAKLLTRSS